MKPDPVLEEVWSTKERLAAEAGYDIRRYFSQLERWSEANPHSGPVFRNDKELRRYFELSESAALREEPRKPGKGAVG